MDKDMEQARMPIPQEGFGYFLVLGFVPDF
jgi:hypothetical protein